MSTSLSRVECKKHLLLFSASTPVGAITSYLAFSFFGSKQVDGVGTALLISVSISREGVAASTSLIWVDSRAEVFFTWQPCCSQSLMIARRLKVLVRKCEFCSSWWGFSCPSRWGVYWTMDMITARLTSRHDHSMFSKIDILHDILQSEPATVQVFC